MKNKECCGTCIHHECWGGVWICCNEDSENWGLETDYDDVCNDYQAREENR